MHVQAPANNDEPKIEARRMVPGKEHALQGRAKSEDGIAMARKLTQGTRTIHPTDCEEMMIPTLKLREQWKHKNQTHLDQNAAQRGGQRAKKATSIGGNGRRRRKIFQAGGETEISKLIERHHGAPEELELTENGRKKLAKIRLEYPTK